MPNNVTHRVIVRGKQAEIEKFKRDCIRPYSEHPEYGLHLDFDSLIPMPKCLEGIEDGSDTDYGLFALTGHYDGRTPLNYRWVKDKGITTREQFKTWLEQKHPKAIPMAQRALAAKDQCGHCTWYDWCRANWGTKWNSYNFREVSDAPERCEFMFDSAWSPPKLIFEKIAERYPALTMDFIAFEDMCNFAAKGRLHNGTCDINIVDADDDLYQAVYG